MQTVESVEEYKEFETPFGMVKRVELAEVEEREPISLEVTRDEKVRITSPTKLVRNSSYLIHNESSLIV